MPDVSIIIPTRSRPHLLPRAVESAQRAGRDVEVILVDDASRDATAKVARSLHGIKYIRLEHNEGVAGARNLGILASRADYIAFLDDDDLRLPGSLDAQVEALKENPKAGFACGTMLMMDQQGRLTGEESKPKISGTRDVFWELLELDFPVMPLSVVVRKECFSRVGLLRSSLPGIDDWDIFVRIAELFPVVVMDQPVSIYRKPTPSSDQGSSAQARHLKRIARHQLQLLGLPRVRQAALEQRREARQRILNRIADTLLWNAAHGAREGAYGFACRNTWTALSLSPARAFRLSGYRKLLSLLRGPGRVFDRAENL